MNFSKHAILARASIALVVVSLSMVAAQSPRLSPGVVDKKSDSSVSLGSLRRWLTLQGKLHRGKQPGNHFTDVQTFLARVQQADLLSRLTEEDWSKVRAKMARFDQASQTGNAGRHPLNNVSITRAIIAFASGDFAETLRLLERQAKEQDKPLELILTASASQWFQHINAANADQFLRLIGNAFQIRSVQEQLSFLKSMVAIRGDAQTIMELAWLDAYQDRVLQKLTPQNGAELVWQRPELLGDSDQRRELAWSWFQRADQDRSLWLLAGELLPLLEDANELDEVLARLTRSTWRASSEVPMEQQAAAIVLQYQAKAASDQKDYDTAIDLLKRSDHLLESVMAKSSGRTEADRWRWELYRIRAMQSLVSAHFQNQQPQQAETNAKKLGERLNMLLDRLESADQLLTEQQRESFGAAIARVDYVRRVNLAELYIRQEEFGEALLLFDSPAQAREIEVSKIAAGLRLQDAENQVSFGRWRAGQLQQQTLHERSDPQLAQVRRTFEAAHAIATDLLDDESVSLSDAEITRAKTLRGTSSFFLLNRDGLLTQAYDSIESRRPTAVERMASVQTAIQDLNAAALWAIAQPQKSHLACQPLIYLGQLQWELDRESAESAFEQSLQLALNAGDINAALSTWMARANRRRQIGDVRFQDDLRAARKQLMTSLPSGQAAKSFNWNRIDVLFNFSIDGYLNDATTQTGHESLASLTRAVELMWQADWLADTLGQDPPSPHRPWQDAESWIRQAMNRPATTWVVRQTREGVHHVQLGRGVSKEGWRHVFQSGHRFDTVEKLMKAKSIMATRPMESDSDRQAELTQRLETLQSRLVPETWREPQLDRELHLILHGELSQFPWSVLLATTHAVPMVSQGTWPRVVERPSDSEVPWDQTAYIGLGIRIFPGQSLEEFLPTAEQEVLAASERFGKARVLQGSQNRATLAALSAELERVRQRASILHLATHGVIDPKSGLAQLVLQDGDAPQTKSHLVTTNDIEKLSIDNCRLAILSSCQSNTVSNLGPLGTGHSIAKSFQRSGASEVVASLWKVDDEAASILVDRFVSYLVNSDKRDTIPRCSAALREAVSELQRHERFADPFFWAPFVLIR